MDLRELGIDEKQIEILQKKKIVSAEALLRQEPLHYWNFSNLLPLDINNEETRTCLAKRMPFAMTGTCISYEENVGQTANMAKLIICDDISGNRLYANIIGVEAFKYSFLENSPEYDFEKSYPVPDNVPILFCGTIDGIRDTCRKKILEINALETPSIKMLSGLKTGGIDSCSRMSLSEAKLAIGNNTFSFIESVFSGMTDGYKLTGQCVRWYLRGLRLDLCLKKTAADSIRLESLLLEKHLIVGGFISQWRYDDFSVLNPPVLSDNIEAFHRYYVQYSSVKGWNNKMHERFVNRAIEKLGSFDFMPEQLLKRAELPSFRTAANLMHHPKTWKQCLYAKKRATFDDLTYLACKLAINQTQNNSGETEAMPLTIKMNAYLEALPYSLTKGQTNAIQSVSERMKNGKRVNSLIQGDVGTGKTCIAFALLIQAAENGFQGALSAPYTTLAWQHFKDMEPIAKELGISIAFLTSETKAKEKKEVYKGLADGSISLVIGTHSIFTDAVVYKNLGLVVIDEEHKFGVVHRENFTEKGIDHCHKITMSATPIPKSLADTIYGEDSEIITILDKPANRLPVKTILTEKDQAAANFIIKEVKAGRQAYIVCPAIEKNQNEDRAFSIEEKEKVYRGLFQYENIKMTVLTGKMKAAEKTEILNDFRDGKIDVLMATTVIEVGMNVPNATVMAITGADRFGFSTLHQLRGRVGRGADQAYCIMQTENANEKLQFMTTTNNGFEIAEEDLRLRGPGSLFGERQSGNNYFISLMLTYPNMFRWIREEVKNFPNIKIAEGIVKQYESLFLPEEKR